MTESALMDRNQDLYKCQQELHFRCKDTDENKGWKKSYSCNGNKKKTKGNNTFIKEK